MKNCPRCASELNKYSKVCPRCGLPVNQMEEFVEKFNLSSSSDEETEQKPKVNTKEEKKRLKAEKKKAKKEEKKARKERESKSDTNFTEYAGNANDEQFYDDDTYAERKRKRNKKRNKLSFDVDEKGQFNIDTSDVEIVGEKTGKIIDERFEQSYSVKKSRGDYRPPKIKWWEIYKISDRYFARRKIKKEVNKAARIKPSFIKKSKLLLLAIFFGYTGAQNFYAKNKKKGFVSLVSLFIWVGVTILAQYVSFFKSIEISIGGLAGFINILIWITDILNISFNKFKYRLQIDKFISEMNVETRAKLGEKYIDLELYHKPWWFRFKVWCQKKKRNWQEYQRDRRQANIDKQKRKLAAAEEKAKIERELYEYEQKQDSKDFVSQKTLDELKSFGESDEENTKESSNNGEENVAPKAIDKNEEEDKQNTSKPQKQTKTVQIKKYNKTVKNTKAAAKKKKK